MVLEEMRLLHLDPKTARERLSFHTGQSMSMGDLKAQPHSDTLPPTRSHLLTQAVHQLRTKHANVWVQGTILIQTGFTQQEKDLYIRSRGGL